MVMTIYIDDFHTSRASLAPSPLDPRRSVPLANMIGTDAAELHAFAAKIGVGDAYYQESGRIYRVPVEEQRKAVLLGATAITFRQLAAMVALFHLGYDMEPAGTAPERRDAIVRGATESLRRVQER